MRIPQILCASVIGLLLVGCSLLLPQAEAPQLQMPALGALGESHNTVTGNTFTRNGFPQLQKKCLLHVAEYPFSPALAKKYGRLQKAHEAESDLVVNDTVLPSSRYLTLEIQDLLGLQQQLNDKNNTPAREFLGLDDHHRIVYKLWVYTPKHQQLVQADALYWGQNPKGQRVLEVHKGNTKTQIPLSDLEVFDYATLGTCWKADTYGRPLIAQLVTGKSCPKGTEKKLRNLEKHNPYFD